MTPEQSREARRLLGWSQLRLAFAAELALPAIIAFEAAGAPAADVILAIQRALETAGALFVANDCGGGAGVRLRKV